MSSRSAIEALLAEIQQLKQEQARLLDQFGERAKVLVYDRDVARWERDVFADELRRHGIPLPDLNEEAA
jgi:hypothetical protein